MNTLPTIIYLFICLCFLYPVLYFCLQLLYNFLQLINTEIFVSYVTKILPTSHITDYFISQFYHLPVYLSLFLVSCLVFLFPTVV